MKKLLFSIVALAIFCASDNLFAQNNSVQESNKKLAVKYHELNPDDINEILSEDFTGHVNERTWNREDHRRVWTQNEYKAEDKILFMVAENNLVAVRFIRTGEIEGESFNAEVMQFMRFENEKIVEVWEVYDASKYE